MCLNCLRPQCWLEGVSNAPRILADGHRHNSSTQSLQHPEALHNESENKHRSRGTLEVVRALTWRWLVGVQGAGARLQGKAEASAWQSQFAEQDPHAAGHIPLTSRGTHSLSQSVARRRFARGRVEVRAGERAVRYWGRRRRGWWLYRATWRHGGDVTVVTLLTVPPTARPPAARPSLR